MAKDAMRKSNDMIERIYFDIKYLEIGLTPNPSPRGEGRDMPCYLS